MCFDLVNQIVIDHGKNNENAKNYICRQTQNQGEVLKLPDFKHTYGNVQFSETRFYRIEFKIEDTSY